MIQNIQFRDSIHRDVVGPTADALMAAVLGEHCAPGAAPMAARSMFYGVAEVLGEAGFREIWSAFQKPTAGRRAGPLEFPGFIEAQAEGRVLPALADLARFDLAYTLAAQPCPAPSIAPSVLTQQTLDAHPAMLLRFQPNWRYVALGWPVHRLLAETLTADVLRGFSGPEPVHLRLSPTGMGVDIAELTAADFALQCALRDGRGLGAAIAAARAIDPVLDPFPIVTGLVEAGAIMDVVLHPAAAPNLRQPIPERM